MGGLCVNTTYDPITRERRVTVSVREVRYMGSTVYGKGTDVDGRLASFVLDRAVADGVADRVQRGEPVEIAIPTWAIFEYGPVPEG
jgi:hypothetical protein